MELAQHFYNSELLVLKYFLFVK